MLVQCPGCRTTYRVSDKAITSANPTFRCSRCKHIFVVALKTETNSPELPAEANEQEGENREFSFAFPQPLTTQSEKPLGITTGDPVSVKQEKDPEFEAAGQSEDTGSLRSPEPRDDERVLISDASQSFQTNIATPAELGSKPPPPPQELNTTPSAVDPQIGQPLSTIPYVTLFGCLLLIFLFLTLAHRVQPGPIDTFIRRIPWFGATVLRNNHLRDNIALQSLRPSIQKLMGNREVFVIAGVATNHNRTSVRQVRIEGRAYSADGKEIEQQTIAVGNAISENIIRDMTAQELSILQKLASQKRFEIAPEESANFALVFLKPTKEIKTFTCRIVSAEEAS